MVKNSIRATGFFSMGKEIESVPLKRPGVMPLKKMICPFCGGDDYTQGRYMHIEETEVLADGSEDEDFCQHGSGDSAESFDCNNPQCQGNWMVYGN